MAHDARRWRFARRLWNGVRGLLLLDLLDGPRCSRCRGPLHAPPGPAQYVGGHPCCWPCVLTEMGRLRREDPSGPPPCFPRVGA